MHESSDSAAFGPSDTSTGRALPRRLMVGAVMVVLLVLAMMADNYLQVDLFLAAIVLLWVIAGTREFYRFCDAADMLPFRRFGVTMSALLVVLTWLSMPGVSFVEDMGLRPETLGREAVPLILLIAVGGAFMLEAFKREDEVRRPLSSIGATLMGVLYVGFLSTFLLRIRHLGASDEGLVFGAPKLTGLLLLVQTIAVAKMMDMGAYFTGRTLGRHKLIPRISPGKTWEGLVGGAVAAALTAWVFQHFWLGPLLGDGFPLWGALMFGVVVGVAGQAGDLAESLLKRSVGAKDSGAGIPGYGGALDVADSLLGAAPVAYMLYLVVV